MGSDSISRYEKAALNTARHHTGQPVVLVSDIHSQTDRVTEFAIELGKRLGKPVGLESIHRGNQPYIDAFAESRIDRQDFLKGLKSGETDSTAFGTTAFYLGKDRAEAFYDHLADTIESGTKIHALGTSRGGARLTNDPGNAELFDRLVEEEAKADVMRLQFMRENRGTIESDPRSFFEQQAREAEARYDSLSLAQQLSYTRLMIEVKDMENEEADTPGHYAAYIGEMYGLTSQSYDRVSTLSALIAEKLSAPGALDIDAGSVIANRRDADPGIARQIQDLQSREGGMVVVYGELHTNHDNDIDAHIRAMGTGVMVVDPRQKTSPEPCPPDIIRELCDAGDLTKAWIRAQTLQNADPDRFEIDIGLDNPKPSRLPDYISKQGYYQGG